MTTKLEVQFSQHFGLPMPHSIPQSMTKCEEINLLGMGCDCVEGECKYEEKKE